MVSSNRLQVYTVCEHSEQLGRDIWRLIINPRYLEEPMFTLEQQKAIHQMADAFLMLNRQRERGRRKAEAQKKKRAMQKDKREAETQI